STAAIEAAISALRSAVKRTARARSVTAMEAAISALRSIAKRMSGACRVATISAEGATASEQAAVGPARLASPAAAVATNVSTRDMGELLGRDKRGSNIE